MPNPNSARVRTDTFAEELKPVREQEFRELFIVPFSLVSYPSSPVELIILAEFSTLIEEAGSVVCRMMMLDLILHPVQFASYLPI